VEAHRVVRPEARQFVRTSSLNIQLYVREINNREMAQLQQEDAGSTLIVLENQYHLAYPAYVYGKDIRDDKDDKFNLDRLCELVVNRSHARLSIVVVGERYRYLCTELRYYHRDALVFMGSLTDPDAVKKYRDEVCHLFDTVGAFQRTLDIAPLVRRYEARCVSLRGIPRMSSMLTVVDAASPRHVSSDVLTDMAVVEEAVDSSAERAMRRMDNIWNHYRPGARGVLVDAFSTQLLAPRPRISCAPSS
jgi:hypothetical protein